MSRTDVYERILDELAGGQMDEIEAKVFQALRRAYPASLTRYDLLESVFGYRPDPSENLNNNTDDRKNRLAISNMLSKGVPIVSTSGGAGYRIDIDLDSWSDMVHELEGRRFSLNEKIEAVERIVQRIETIGRSSIPTDVPVTPRQLSFIGEPAGERRT